MKWKVKEYDGPKYGDRRKVTRFLLLPKELAGEWRWLDGGQAIEGGRVHRLQLPLNRVAAFVRPGRKII